MELIPPSGSAYDSDAHVLADARTEVAAFHDALSLARARDADAGLRGTSVTRTAAIAPAAPTSAKTPIFAWSKWWTSMSS